MKVEAEYTNSCVCEDYNEDTDTWSVSETCYGDCYDCQVEDFTNITEHLFAMSSNWKLTGFPVWNGTVDGIFTAETPKQLLDAMTPDRADWTMKVTVSDDGIVAILYHHDAPMGGKMTVTPIMEEA